MQAERPRLRLSAEVETCEMEGFENLLGRLKGLKERVLLPLYSYEAQTNETGALYYLDVDEPGESLQDFALRIKSGSESPFSPIDLSNIAVACIHALSKGQELSIAALDLGVIYISKHREIRVNAIEAYLEKSRDSVAQIIAKCAFLKEDCSEMEMQTLPRLVSPDLSSTIEQLLLPSPNFPLLAQSCPQYFPSEPAKEAIFCSNCHESKPSLISQVCERHFFCSSECLSPLQEMNGRDKTQCPLCTMKKAPSLHIKKKVPNEIRKCTNCNREFELNLSEIWRQERKEKEILKAFCSLNCFQSHSKVIAIPPISAAIPPISPTIPPTSTSIPPSAKPNILSESAHMRSYPCLVCEQIASIECTLHCASHSLCSEKCRNMYYLGGNLEENTYQGVLICYGCLEQSLRDIERIGEIPELECLANKLLQRNEAIAKLEQLRIQEVVQCGPFVCLKALSWRHFRTLCLFCSQSIVVSKHFAEDFAINDTTPFLLACELQLHGVCSTRCLRVNLPRNSLQTIRCPKCPNALIVTETLQIALNHRNPTQECLRRTAYLDLCKADCAFTYSQQPCRHEFCGHVIDRYLASGSAGLTVVCLICGCSSLYEEVLATGQELTLVKEEIK